VIIDRIAALNFRYSINSGPFIEQITKLVMTGNIDRAIKLCGAAPNAALARIVSTFETSMKLRTASGSLSATRWRSLAMRATKCRNAVKRDVLAGARRGDRAIRPIRASMA